MVVLKEEIFNSFHIWRMWWSWKKRFLTVSKNENFPIFNILAYEISETTYPIELKFSGIREGVNKLAVLKFQSNSSSLQKNVKIWNAGKSGP